MFARQFRCTFSMSSSFLIVNLFIYNVYSEGLFIGASNFWLCFCIENFSDFSSFIFNLLQIHIFSRLW